MNGFIYRVSRGLLRLLVCVLFRYEVIGAENIPAEGPLVLCANHRSNWDPPLVGISVPRQVYFMAKEELYRIPVLSAWLRAVGAFPVKRGTADLGSLRRAMGLLKAGQVVGVFPEGTRSRTGRPREASGGAALLAVAAGAPVVPVAISGGMRILGRVRVQIGPSVDLSPYRKGGKRDSQEMSAIANKVIMGRIREMLAESPADGRAG